MSGLVTDPLDLRDVELILESLKYTRQRFETYDSYPDEGFRQQRLAQVDEVVAKLREIEVS